MKTKIPESTELSRQQEMENQRAPNHRGGHEKGGETGGHLDPKKIRTNKT